MSAVDFELDMWCNLPNWHLAMYRLTCHISPYLQRLVDLKWRHLLQVLNPTWSKSASLCVCSSVCVCIHCHPPTPDKPPEPNATPHLLLHSWISLAEARVSSIQRCPGKFHLWMPQNWMIELPSSSDPHPYTLCCPSFWHTICKYLCHTHTYNIYI